MLLAARLTFAGWFVFACSATGVLAQNSTLPPSVASLFTELDFSIVEDAKKLVEEGQKLAPDRTDLSEKPDRSTKAQRLGKFRSLRSKLVKRIPELRTLADGVRQIRATQRTKLADRKNYSDSDLRSLESSLRAAKSHREVVQSETRDVQAEPDSPEKSQKLERQKRRLDDVNNFISVTERDIQNQTRIKEDEKRQRELEITNLEGQIKEIDTILTDIVTLTRRLDETLAITDEASHLMLQTETDTIQYTNWATVAFSFLVGTVIVGFFFIAFKSEEIKKAIFAGDSGIQFVTLFSLVIAIILFGILHILEGKELSALLGGLSGYILGRGTAKVAEPVPSSQPPTVIQTTPQSPPSQVSSAQPATP
ncbi:MAG TPA: hypothetical protein VF601_20485 [Beijerinckiaceae bacterium]|jgi:hypothetical protein